MYCFISNYHKINSLKQHHLLAHSSVAQRLAVCGWVLYSVLEVWNQGVGHTKFLSGVSGKKLFLFIHVLGRIQVLAVGGLMCPFPYWLPSALRGPSQAFSTWIPETVHSDSLWHHGTMVSVHGILQARILEWVVIPFSRGSSQPRGQSALDLPCCRQILYHLSHQGRPWTWTDAAILDFKQVPK